MKLRKRISTNEELFPLYTKEMPVEGKMLLKVKTRTSPFSHFFLFRDRQYHSIH